MTEEQKKQIIPLAYYLFQLKRLLGENIQIAIPQNGEYDYHLILDQVQNQVNDGLNILADNGLKTDWYIPIEDIDIEREDYEVIARQIYPPESTSWQHIKWVNRPEAPNDLADYFERYIAGLPGGSTTRSTTEAILSRMNSLATDENDNRTSGLVVGRVQSGKTQNFTGLILKAIGERWNVIVVLTSDNTALASQTRDRLFEAFRNVGIDARNCKELDFLHQPTTPLQPEIHDNYFCWGVAMKESHSLQRIIDSLDRTPKETVEKIRLLIIDDEADNATPNSAIGKDRFSDEEIDDYLTLLRDEGQENIADWLGALKDFDIPGDSEEQSEEQQSFLKCLERCNRNNIFAFLHDWRNYLSLVQTKETGETVDVYNEVIAYYTIRTGHSANAIPILVNVLKSIFDIVKTKSTINHKICRVIAQDVTGNYSYAFKDCSYVGYTATPYACVFNERPGKQAPYYPGFIYSLPKGQGYFGLDEIFGKDLPITPIPKMPIIYPVTDSETKNILTPLKKEDDYLDIDINLTATWGDKQCEWGSLKIMIQWAFCAAAARRYFRLERLKAPDLTEKGRKKLEEINARWSSMLVNIAPKQKIHKRVKKLIIDFLKYKCENKNGFVEECLTTWDQMTNAPFLTEEKFQQLFPEYENVTTYPSREDVRAGLEYFISSCNPAEYTTSNVHVIEINSTPSGRNYQCEFVQAEKYDTTEKFGDRIIHRKNEVVPTLLGDHLWIISGGNTISRGLTLPGLVSSYFDRIQKSVAVDTMTQMGRWFGYRRGYELLPRLAMSGATIEEIKKVAVIEDKMHQEIEEKFVQNISPSDPTGYLVVYTCGRILSGRQKALKSLAKSFGSMATTNKFYLRDENVTPIYNATDRFLAESTAAYSLPRDPAEYQYSHYDLRTNIPAATIQEYLGEIKRYYPTASKLMLEAVQKELSKAEYMHTQWSVVVGEPEALRDCTTFDLGGKTYRAGKPEVQITEEGIASYSNTRLHLPYYAMIPTSKLRTVDLQILKEYEGGILNKLSEYLPADVASILQAGENIDERFKNTLTYYENNNEPLPNSFHSLLDLVSKGYRNRSASDYLERTHDVPPFKNPILQIYLINPPEGTLNDGHPVISVAVYWPDHQPEGFVPKILGLPEDFLRTRITITTERFYQTVENLLRESNFPLQVSVLRSKVCGELGCDETYFTQRICKEDQMQQFNYESFPGKDAYCISGWADGTTHLERLNREFCFAAYETLLQSAEELSTLELMQKTIARESKFKGFFNPQLAPGRSDFNTMFRDFIEKNGFAVRCPSLRPTTYIFDQEMKQGE